MLLETRMRVGRDTLVEHAATDVSCVFRRRRTAVAALLLATACSRQASDADDAQEPFDIAFVRDGSVYGVHGDGSGDRVLIPDLASSSGCPLRWSPDGSMLAIDLGDHLVLLDPLGRSVMHGLPGSLPNFSPDGTRVVEAVDTGFVIRRVDGTTELVLPPTDNLEWLAWSPEGERLAFRRSQPPTIIVISAQDGAVLQSQPAPPTCPSGCIGAAAWGEAGLVVPTAPSLIEPDGPIQDLALVDLKQQRWRALGGGDRVRVTDPRWSLDGRLAFARHGIDELSWQGHEIAVSDLVEHVVLGPAMSFDWSPDGDAIVAESAPDPDQSCALGCPHALMRFGLDGSAEVLVDDPVASETCPTWRPYAPLQ